MSKTRRFNKLPVVPGQSRLWRAANNESKTEDCLTKLIPAEWMDVKALQLGLNSFEGKAAEQERYDCERLDLADHFRFEKCARSTSKHQHKNT